jgi:hypothetical protein
MPIHDAVASFLRAPASVWKNVRWFTPRTIAEDVAPIIIMGTPRSGTTLLQTLLCGHSQLCGPAKESSGILMFRNAFEPRYADFSAEEQMAKTEKSADVIDFYRRYCLRLCAREGATAIVDKMIGVSPYFIRLIVRHLPKAKLVYISRDGRDCYCSARNNPFIPQRQSLARFARLYARNEKRRLRYLSPLPCHYHLRYEDLVSRVTEELPKLMDFLGYSFEPQQLAAGATLRSQEMRKATYHANLEHAVEPRSVGRFRRELTPEEIAEFENHAGPVLRALGYT